mgnify:FL=1
MNHKTLKLKARYTGFKDKKGKKIYEYDIVRFYDFYVGDFINKKIIFNKGSFIIDMGDDAYFLNDGFAKEMEIIGNFFKDDK